MHVRTETLQPKLKPNPKRQSHRASKRLRALLVLTDNHRVHLACIKIPAFRERDEAVFYLKVRRKLGLHVTSVELVQAFVDRIALDVERHRPVPVEGVPDVGRVVSDEEREALARVREIARQALLGSRPGSSGKTQRPQESP